MDQTKVVRIEKGGTGFFRNQHLVDEMPDWFAKINQKHQDFNTPIQDGLDLYKDDKEWFCAYKSVEQLQKWLTTEQITKLYEEGFRAYMYDIKEYQEGDDQIIFTLQGVLSKTDISEILI